MLASGLKRKLNNMVDAHKKKLRLTTFIYWFLLVYIIAALLWWLFSLLSQDQAMYQVEKEKIEEQYAVSSPGYHQEMARIEDLRRRSNTKYIGEGITFLVLILFGAVYIYRSVRKQFRLQQQQQNFMMSRSSWMSFSSLRSVYLAEKWLAISFTRSEKLMSSCDMR